MAPVSHSGAQARNAKKRPSDAPASRGANKKPKVQSGPERILSTGGRDAPRAPKDARRAKLHSTRNIAAQHPDAALKDGELDVQAFLNARSFEIKAMDESMRRTTLSSTSRAFQKVPYPLRRRAAAHNHKRVPKRLQRRARWEMKEDNTPTVNSATRQVTATRGRLRAQTARRLDLLARKTRKKKKLLERGGLDPATIEVRTARPKIRRNVLNDPVMLAPKFRKRQLSKTWLPTHAWHTKRARMTPPEEPLWRFAVPMTTNEKIYRPTHRAYWEKGAIAWDMSYMSTISLCGTAKSVEHVLRALGMVAEWLWNGNPKGQRWRQGQIHWTATLSRPVGGEARPIGPATVIWNPEEQSGPSSESKTARRLFLRIHPSAFLETFNELLRVAKGITPRPYIEDLRYEIGSIDVTGPQATEALYTVLKPYCDQSKGEEAHASAFESLAGYIAPAVLPSGTLMAYSVMDPRLRYPPRREDLSPARKEQAVQAAVEWNAAAPTRPFALFDRDARFKASRLPSQKHLNNRRGKNAPGTFLEPTQVDPKIPVLLLALRAASNSGSDSTSPGRWSLMLPWKCVPPIWHNLMHCPLSTGGNPKFGGLNEIRQISFEQGLPWFPGDFPGTDAGLAWELQKRLDRKKAWDRMPKGKRTSYETLDLGASRKGEVGEGWKCDYEGLLRLPSAAAKERADVEMTDTANDAVSAEPRSQGDNPPKNVLGGLIHLSKAAFEKYLTPTVELAPRGSIVTIRFQVLGRGVVDACARIYRLPLAQPNATSTHAYVPATLPSSREPGKLPTDLREQWLAQIPKKPEQNRPKRPPRFNSTADLDIGTRKRLLAQELVAGQAAPYPPPASTHDNINGHPLCPDAADLLGFVTTGSYNLRTGRASGVATILAEKALEEMLRYKKKDDAAARICVVRNAGQNVGWVAKWELV